MKRLTLVTLLVLLASVANVQANNKREKNLQEVTFLTNIDCPNCAKKVDAQLPFEKGVKDMKIEVEKKTIWIKFDSTKTTVEKLAKAIEKIGYTATPLKDGEVAPESKGECCDGECEEHEHEHHK